MQIYTELYTKNSKVSCLTMRQKYILRRELLMAKTNYSYEKRGRELEKQKKQEEKRQKKLNKKNEDNKEEEFESRPSSDDPLEK